MASLCWKECSGWLLRCQVQWVASLLPDHPRTLAASRAGRVMVRTPWVTGKFHNRNFGRSLEDLLTLKDRYRIKSWKHSWQATEELIPVVWSSCATYTFPEKPLCLCFYWISSFPWTRGNGGRRTHWASKPLWERNNSSLCCLQSVILAIEIKYLTFSFLLLCILPPLPLSSPYFFVPPIHFSNIQQKFSVNFTELPFPKYFKNYKCWLQNNAKKLT